MVEAIKCTAVQRQEVAVRQFDLHAKLIADQNIFLPRGKAPTDTDLLEPRVLLLAELCVNDRRYIERKSDVLSLVYRHFVTTNGEAMAQLRPRTF